MYSIGLCYAKLKIVWPWDGPKLSHMRMRLGSNPGLPRVTSRLFARAPGRLAYLFLVLSPLRIACVFLHCMCFPSLHLVFEALSEYGVNTE
jgi:hypothetical protein